MSDYNQANSEKSLEKIYPAKSLIKIRPAKSLIKIYPAKSLIKIRPAKRTYLSDEELLFQTKQIVKNERALLKNILLNLREIEDRKLYLKKGYSSLFVFCTRGLGYSESAAQRRIDTMRAIKELPEVAQKIEEGKLTLSSVSLVQKTIRQEQKLAQQAARQEKKIAQEMGILEKIIVQKNPGQNSTSFIISKDKKRELFKSIENKTSKESEKILVKEFPQTANSLRSDKTKQLTETTIEIRFVADKSLMEKLERIKHKFSHKNIRPTYNELFHLIADQVLKEPRSQQLKKTSSQRLKIPKSKQREAPSLNQNEYKDPLNSLIQNRYKDIQTSLSQNHKRSKYIPAQMKRFIFQRDNGECQYIDSLSGNKCASKHLIQMDHKFPLAFGGKTIPENLQLLCAAHNHRKGGMPLGHA